MASIVFKNTSRKNIDIVVRKFTSAVIKKLADKYGFCAENAEEFININIDDIFMKKPRKNVEYNCCELVDAILLAIHGGLIPDHTTATGASIISLCQEWVDTKQLPDCIRFNDNADLLEYMNDLKIKQKIVAQRIETFTQEVVVGQQSGTKFNLQYMKCVYVSGKKNTHPQIQTLNSSLDIKERKGDIYVEYNNGDIIGWSCKQSLDAPKSNYSVEKMLPKERSSQLNKIKQTYLANNGFPTFSKTTRKSVNQLFYPKNTENPYWNELRTAISENNSSITTELSKSLAGSSIPYPIYEFDGTSIKKLNSATDDNNIKETTFEEHAAYYKMKNGEERATAKLFYQLCVGSKKYRVEIRWKGCIHSASPQFLIYDDNWQ